MILRLEIPWQRGLWGGAPMYSSHGYASQLLPFQTRYCTAYNCKFHWIDQTECFRFLTPNPFHYFADCVRLYQLSVFDLPSRHVGAVTVWSEVEYMYDSTFRYPWNIFVITMVCPFASAICTRLRLLRFDWDIDRMFIFCFRRKRTLSTVFVYCIHHTQCQGCCVRLIISHIFIQTNVSLWFGSIIPVIWFPSQEGWVAELAWVAANECWVIRNKRQTVAFCR